MKAVACLLALALLTGCAGSGAAPPSESATPTLDEMARSIERGRILFRNKGCVSCHIHGRVAGESGVALEYLEAPDLTQYTNDAAFLHRFLADPVLVSPESKMPNLQLATDAIEDLIAFLNEPR